MIPAGVFLVVIVVSAVAKLRLTVFGQPVVMPWLFVVAVLVALALAVMLAVLVRLIVRDAGRLWRPGTVTA